MITPQQLLHEIRTPLGNIKSFTEFIKMNGYNEVSGYDKGFVDDYINAVNIGIESVWEIITYYTDRINSKDYKKPFIKEVNLRYLVNNIVIMARLNVKLLRQIEISFSIDKNLSVTVKTDKVLLEGVLRNLLENAMKFSKDDGKIFIRVDKTKEGMSLSVQDYGCGIEDNSLKIIFEPYVFLSSSVFQGMGIGLAKTKDDVDTLGGTITVESKMAEGSIFTVNLPLYSNFLS